MLLGSSQKSEEKERYRKTERKRGKRRKRKIREEKGEGGKREKSRSMVTLFVSKEKHGRRDLGASPLWHVYGNFYIPLLCNTIYI